MSPRSHATRASEAVLAQATARAAARSFVRRAGLGLVEAMISLAITAALLTAVAGAFSASAAAINQNDEYFQATQTGRVALNRILTQVRRGAVDENSTTTNLHLLTETGADVAYKYDATNKRILFVSTVDGVSTEYVLARNVGSASFNCQAGTDYAGNPCIARVSVAISVTVGDNTTLFSGSGTPRRNLSF